MSLDPDSVSPRRPRAQTPKRASATLARWRRGGLATLPRRRNGGGRVLVAGASAALLAGAGWVAAADERPVVDLDRLLRLPPSEEDLRPNPRPGGATRSEWSARFSEARADLENARVALAAAQKELEELAEDSSTWQMAVPGATANANENSPISFRLVQEIRRQREEVEHNQSRLRELVVEANLAGVPEAWTQRRTKVSPPAR